MKASAGSVMVYDETAGELKITAWRGIAPGAVERVRLKPGEGVAGTVFETGESIYVPDPAENPRYVAACAGEKCEAFICVPVKTEARTYGVLNVHSGGRTDFSADYNLKLLSALTSQTANSIENLRLHDTLHNFYLEMVETLTRVIDVKDSYTHDHGGRARRKARRIAQELRLAGEDARHVEYAALLHDIGKIGVPEIILTKPGKLTETEYLEIKKHPVIGHQILFPVGFLSQVAAMVLYHQEWFNGAGYPEGRRGGEIPLGSRIVSVIDAWDAMVSNRPYRKALERARALAELKNGSGTQFDPDIINTFLRLEETEWKPETACPAS